MRNRAKCKKCLSIVESFHPSDLVMCECGAIGVDGGPDNYKVLADQWDNFIRLTDDGTELPIKVATLEKNEVCPPSGKTSREEKLAALDEMIKSYEALPTHAMTEACTHYDVLSVLLLLKSLSTD